MGQLKLTYYPKDSRVVRYRQGQYIAGMGAPRLSPALQQELILALLDYAASPSAAADERLRVTTDHMCSEARRDLLKPEDMVIGIKRLYEGIQCGDAVMQSRLRGAYDRLLSGCIQAYFATPPAA